MKKLDLATLKSVSGGCAPCAPPPCKPAPCAPAPKSCNSCCS
ncbi:hypothetical protein QO016_003738 [Methylobacterium persicinum]|uniref:Uncharacterized protein n=1 Tax=Methylobacterium persicinum TaxID=374426 RepID=A0ABU0HPI6_9HYPH|nr:hypothetical protein [Methylobacterium persicinum]GJE39614.1 hypothetical protein KHHGKMAE_3698 [Methylobacterium persicinum]